MTARLGYYAHHHGRGHVHRATSVAAHLRHPLTLLTSAETDAWDGDLLRLSDDIASSPQQDPLPSVLHYAPIGVEGLRRRAAAITDWFVRAEPAALVVDVSVEVALLARLSGVAPIVVRQAGRRTDPAHRAAYESAVLLLAPWPQLMEDPSAIGEVRDRTFYTGGFCRFDGRTLSRQDARQAVGFLDDDLHVVVVRGGGGDRIEAEDLRAAAEAAPRWRWTVLGAPAAWQDIPGVDVRGWVTDPFVFLRAADVVVAHGGTNAVFEAAAARVPLIVIPAPRPFDEQVRQADRLRELDAALVVDRWPSQPAWPRLLARAREQDTSMLATLNDGKGARRAAERLDQLVTEMAA